MKGRERGRITGAVEKMGWRVSHIHSLVTSFISTSRPY